MCDHTPTGKRKSDQMNSDSPGAMPFTNGHNHAQFVSVLNGNGKPLFAVKRIFCI